MNTKYTSLAAGMLLAAMLGLSACSSSGGDGKTPEATASPAVTASPQGSAPASAAVGAPASAAPSADSAVPSASAGAQAPSEASSAPGPEGAGGESVQSQLRELMELAKQGHAPGIPYTVHTGMIDEVKDAWGKPDIEESAGKGIYATYKAKQAVIGCNKGGVLIDIRSSADELHRLTLKNIEASLGSPEEITASGSDRIYTYPAGGQFQLKFVIPESTGRVDHISVFSPKDAVNNMAG